MQVNLASVVGRISRSIAFVPRTIEKHPIPFIVLCFKALLSLASPLSGDFLAITSLVVGGQSYWHGSYIAWAVMSKLVYSFWLALPIAHPDVTIFLGNWFYNPVPSIVLLVFLLKLPMLIGDVVTGLLIYKIILMRRNSPEDAYRGFQAWFYNPLVVLLGVMFGSIDVVAGMFVLACLYCFARSRILLSFIFLLVATVLRTYPILLSPILIILLWRREGTRKRLMIGIIAMIAFAAIVAIMWINIISNGLFFLSIALYQGDYLFFLSSLMYPASITGGQPIALTVILLILVLFLIHDCEEKKGEKSVAPNDGFRVTDYVFLFFIVLLGFSYWNPQFLLWIIPFATIDFALGKSSKRLLFSFNLAAALVIVISFGFYFTSVGNSFFFIQNFNPLMTQLSQWINALSHNVNQTYVSIMLRFPFIAVCAFYLVMISKQLIFPKEGTLAGARHVRRRENTERRTVLQETVKE